MIAKLTLPLLSVFMIYVGYEFTIVKGLIAKVEESRLLGIVPGGDVPLRTVYTGLDVPDQLFSTLTIFFWPVVDGTHLALRLHSIAFLGSLCSASVLITLESWRRGNAHTVTAFAVLFNLAAQGFTYGLIIPAYFTLHLYTSITVQKPTMQSLQIPRVVLLALPMTFIFGMILPSMLMALPTPRIVTADTKQIMIAIWQLWPIYVDALLYLIHAISAPSQDSDYSPGGLVRYRRSLRKVYAFAFATTAIPHILCLSIALCAVVVPGLVGECYREALHPYKVYDTSFPWAAQAVQTSTFASTVQLFLRWDYLLGSIGVMVWAMILHLGAPRQALNKRVGKVQFLVKTTLLWFCAGPVGVAVVLIWERDELILSTNVAKALDRKLRDS